MTVAVVFAGLLPILVGSGTGSEVMSRIAAPMVGGMVTAPLLSMLVVPAAWLLLHRRRGRARPAGAIEARAREREVQNRLAPMLISSASTVVLNRYARMQCIAPIRRSGLLTNETSAVWPEVPMTAEK